MVDSREVLTAKVADIERRLTALEASPPVPNSDSADLTMVPPASSIVCEGVTYTIGSGKAVLNDVPVANTGGVVLLKLVKHPADAVPAGVYQRNSYGSWYGPVTASNGGDQVAGDPSVKSPAPTPTPTPTPTPPPTPAGSVQPSAAAKAAGYTNLVFFSGFDSASEMTSDRSGNTTSKWYQTGGLQYTIANSILTMTNSISSYQAGVSSVANGNAPLTTPGSIRAGNGNGLRFKYGCFECLQKVDPNKISGNGWIAWWASGFQHNVVGDHSKNSVELDFFEMFQGGASSTGLWNWAANPVTTVDTFATSGWGDQTYLVDQSTANKAADNFADWFIVGGAVTPTKVEVYWNSKARRASGIADTTIFRVDTTRNYTVNAGGNQVNARFDAPNLCDLQLLLGGSSGSPYQIDYVAVWQ